MRKNFRHILGKYSVRQPYSMVRYFPIKIRAFIDMLRPMTALAAFVSGISIVHLYSAYYRIEFSIDDAFFAGMVLALLQGAGQAINQSTREEVEIDKINGKTYRPTVIGIISLKEGMIFSVSVAILAVSLGFYKNPVFGLCAFILAFFAFFYTVPPLRMKKRFLINNLWQGFSRGFLPWITVWSLSGRFDFLPFALGIIVSIWLTGYQTTKDFQDISGDTKFGIKTIPVVMGIEKSRIFIAIMGLISFILLVLFIIFKIIPWQYITLFVLIIPSIIIIRELKTLKRSNIIENNSAWGIMYLTLGLFYILPAAIARI